MQSIITFRNKTATFIFREVPGKDEAVAMLYTNLLHLLTIYQVEINFRVTRNYTNVNLLRLLSISWEEKSTVCGLYIYLYLVNNP